MAWRDSLCRSLMSIARASAFSSCTPRFTPPGLRPSVFSSRTNSGIFSFSNPSTLGQLGCTQSLLPLHSTVAGARMMSFMAASLRKRNILTTYIAAKLRGNNLRDHKRKLLAEKCKLTRKLYKAFCKTSDLRGDMKDKHRYKLSKLLRMSSSVRVRNPYISTGRNHSVDKFFRMSRIVSRGLANRGDLMGAKKSSW